MKRKIIYATVGCLLVYQVGCSSIRKWYKENAPTKEQSDLLWKDMTNRINNSTLENKLW